MNLRAYHRRQRRLLLAALTGLAFDAGALFLPWRFVVSAFSEIFLTGFVIFLASAAAAGLMAWKFNREATRRSWNAERTEHERTLRARAHGNSVDELKNDALRQGADLFGPDAALRVVRVCDISTALRRDLGAFTADVLVRAEPARESTDA
jgi:hypothetical protein